MKLVNKVKRSHALILVAIFCSIAAVSEPADAGGVGKAFKKVTRALKNMAKGIFGIFVDLDADVHTSPTNVTRDMAFIINVNDQAHAGQVSKDDAGQTVRVGNWKKK